ncbi:MAG: tRNA (adenosine(37)-N6)-threonylcarbamoyltransferase complex ATPase subunit type 1 TsaE [Candidatus Magasanikbacteria bacterium]|nr:tRNA (adenosine(37)-N6)-threonylcarbamoyltransferase complex ATPase subunit type 1 TsaE [Candidatus Magasanikbacteria bacterium]
MKHIAQSALEMEQFGKKNAKFLKGGHILLLHGELGTGKTTLVKGIACGLGIVETITSPTFAIMNLYTLASPKQGITKLVHIDTYRLEHEKELLEIGAQDYIGEDSTLCIIEWPEKLTTILQAKLCKDIFLCHTEEKNFRAIETKNF